MRSMVYKGSTSGVCEEYGVKSGRRKEGTGTRPDYFVNYDGKKVRGRSVEKIAQKSRKSCAVNDQGCGCIGTVDSRRNFAQS